MKPKIRITTLFMITVALFITSARSNAQDIVFDVATPQSTYYNGDVQHIGDLISQDMIACMPKDPAFYIALSFASNRVGDASFKSYQNGVLDATNEYGNMSRTVTIETSGQFTIAGSLSAGPVTGSIGQTTGQKTTVTDTLSFSWETILPKKPDGSIDFSGQLVVSYSYTCDGITRHGKVTLAITLELINALYKDWCDKQAAALAAAEAAANSGGGEGSSPPDINLPEGVYYPNGSPGDGLVGHVVLGTETVVSPPPPPPPKKPPSPPPPPPPPPQKKQGE